MYFFGFTFTLWKQLIEKTLFSFSVKGHWKSELAKWLHWNYHWLASWRVQIRNVETSMWKVLVYHEDRIELQITVLIFSFQRDVFIHSYHKDKIMNMNLLRMFFSVFFSLSCADAAASLWFTTVSTCAGCILSILGAQTRLRLIGRFDSI